MGWPVCALAALARLPPDYRRSLSAHVTKLREDKIGDGSGYDRSAPPTSLRLEPNVSQAGTDVRVQLRFFKLTEVALDRGSLTAKVWWRMKFQDTRLAWNESAYGGITQAEYAAVSYSDQESTEIWLPDITPYNGKFGLMDSFDPAVARVTSSGDVQWSRPGNLEVHGCVPPSWCEQRLFT